MGRNKFNGTLQGLSLAGDETVGLIKLRKYFKLLEKCL